LSLPAAALLGLVALAMSQQGPATAAADVTAVVEAAPVEEDEDGNFDVDLKRKPEYDDSKNVMSKEDAQKLDAAAKALDEFPDFLPMTPVLFPDERDAHDAEIADRLKDVKDRDTIILLPDGTKVPFWQTLQYANRHFEIYITRFFEKKGGVVIPFKNRTRAWGVSSLFRKMLCHPDFLKWTEEEEFVDVTGKEVYKSFEQGREGQAVKAKDLIGARTAQSNGRVITFDKNMRNFGETPVDKLLPTYAHETSHDLGYNHKTQVPYPIGSWAKKPGLSLTDYKVYDLAATPNFEVKA